MLEDAHVYEYQSLSHAYLAVELVLLLLLLFAVCWFICLCDMSKINGPNCHCDVRIWLGSAAIAETTLRSWGISSVRKLCRVSGADKYAYQRI